MNTEYSEIWDAYYRDLLVKQRGPFWEVEPERGVGNDYQLFSSYMDHHLPIVDFGCGTGKQAKWLSGKFDKVVGLDVSSAAISRATELYGQEGLTFEVRNITDPADARAVSNKLGDVHVYIRGVIHQIKKSDLRNLTEGLSLLLGRQGYLFISEVSDNIRSHFDQDDKFRKLPDVMKRILLGKLPPNGISPEAVTEMFPNDRFEIELLNEDFLQTDLKYMDGTFVAIPCTQALIKVRF